MVFTRDVDVAREQPLPGFNEVYLAHVLGGSGRMRKCVHVCAHICVTGRCFRKGREGDPDISPKITEERRNGEPRPLEMQPGTTRSRCPFLVLLTAKSFLPPRTQTDQLGHQTSEGGVRVNNHGGN